MTVIRIFTAVVVVTAIVTIAVVIIANTADVDSMADPTPRAGEDEDGWPRVPDEQMRRIDAALPRHEVNAKWDFNKEGMVQ